MIPCDKYILNNDYAANRNLYTHLLLSTVASVIFFPYKVVNPFVKTVRNKPPSPAGDCLFAAVQVPLSSSEKC